MNPSPPHNPHPASPVNLRSEPKAGHYCPRCYLSGDQLGSCSNFALGCPDPLPIKADSVMEVSCGPCGKRLAIPVADLMRNKVAGLGTCSRDTCAATLMPPLLVVDPLDPAKAASEVSFAPPRKVARKP